MPPTAPIAEATRGYQKHFDKPGSPPLQVTQPDKPRHRKVRFVPKLPKQLQHDRLPAEIKDAFPRFGTFQRNQLHRSLRVGLPHQRRPPAGFLTLSVVLSRRNLAALFRAASTRRLRWSRELFPSVAADAPFDARCSFAAGPCRTTQQAESRCRVHRRCTRSPASRFTST